MVLSRQNIISPSYMGFSWYTPCVIYPNNITLFCIQAKYTICINLSSTIIGISNLRSHWLKFLLFSCRSIHNGKRILKLASFTTRIESNLDNLWSNFGILLKFIVENIYFFFLSIWLMLHYNFWNSVVMLWSDYGTMKSKINLKRVYVSHV